MNVSIIIVSYNTCQLTLECLRSIFKYENTQTFEIIVVDNASQDGSVSAIKKEFPQLKLIENHQNSGFARANNQGIHESSGEYVLLLNSDTKFLAPNTLDALINTSRSQANAVVVPRLLNQDGSNQASIFRLPTMQRAIQEYWLGIPKSFSKYNQENSGFIEAAVMAVMLIPRTVFNTVGVLDEGYFMYFEDLEFCRRLKKNNLPLYFESKIHIAHHHGSSGSNVAPPADQWRRLIPGSKRYHGLFSHTVITIILWLAGKRDNILSKNKYVLRKL